jgi:hypothetical protein
MAHRTCARHSCEDKESQNDQIKPFPRRLLIDPYLSGPNHRRVRRQKDWWTVDRVGMSSAIFHAFAHQATNLNRVC